VFEFSFFFLFSFGGLEVGLEQVFWGEFLSQVTEVAVAEKNRRKSRQELVVDPLFSFPLHL
jgi:hypothetical protein